MKVLNSIEFKATSIASTAIIEFAQSVEKSYTIDANKNAMSAGPITISDGVTLIVEDGATWTII